MAAAAISAVRAAMRAAAHVQAPGTSRTRKQARRRGCPGRGRRLSTGVPTVCRRAASPPLPPSAHLDLRYCSTRLDRRRQSVQLATSSFVKPDQLLDEDPFPLLLPVWPRPGLSSSGSARVCKTAARHAPQTLPSILRPPSPIGRQPETRPPSKRTAKQASLQLAE